MFGYPINQAAFFALSKKTRQRRFATRNQHDRRQTFAMAAERVHMMLPASFE